MFNGPGFIVALVAVCTVGWVINNWIRARHGYPLEDEWGGKTARPDGQAIPQAERKIALLSSENEQLTGKMLRLEERIAVLERIATDPARRTAEEIEKLRD